MTESDRRIWVAMDDTDHCCEIEYRGERRLVSPIRYTHEGKILLAFCLRDGHPKSFHTGLVYCHALVASHKVLCVGK